MTGFFVFDAMASAVTDWDVATRGGDETVFPPFTYAPANGAARALFGQTTLLFDGPIAPELARNRQLRLTFSAPLTGAERSVPISVFGPLGEPAECYNCNPYRVVASGSVTADVAPTPEPTTVLLVCSASVLLLRRKRPVCRC